MPDVRVKVCPASMHDMQNRAAYSTLQVCRETALANRMVVHLNCDTLSLMHLNSWPYEHVQEGQCQPSLLSVIRTLRSDADPLCQTVATHMTPVRIPRSTFTAKRTGSAERCREPASIHKAARPFTRSNALQVEPSSRRRMNNSKKMHGAVSTEWPFDSSSYLRFVS